MQATEKVRFIDGVAEYVGILRDFSLRPDERIIMSDMRAHPARINFGRQAHVYDVRKGVYRVYRQTIGTGITLSCRIEVIEGGMYSPY